MTRVFIAAPTPVMRAGLRSMLTSPAIEITGESASLNEVSLDLASAEVLVLGSESLLKDFSPPGSAKPLSLVLLSDNQRLATTLNSLSSNGWALVSPDAPVAELQAVIEAVAQGLVVLPRLAVSGLLEATGPAEGLSLGPLEEPLTTREQEILELLSQGLPNKLIARQLQISEHTVKFHVSSLYTKLDASSRAEAVSRGARLGLITF